MATVYSYVRFSSKKQEQGDSLRRQIKAGDDWLAQHPQHSLDTSLRLQDLGVSAFRGANLDEKGSLGAFIALAKQQDSPIQKGSILLIERLDRFSRQQTRKAYRSFVELVEAGVTVQTLDPPQAINEDNIDDLHVVLPLILQMTMAHEQSKEKSRRVGSVWEAKRLQARQGQPMFRRCPAWLEWREDAKAFVARADAVEVVQFIFRRTIEGCGQRQLVIELNAQFPPLGTSGKWNSSYVQKVLSDRAVLGELQPYKFNSVGERVRVGEPIVDYYPRVIEEDVFLAASTAKSSRRKAKGPSAGFVNILVGLVQGSDGHAMHIQTARVYGKKKSKYVQRRLISYGHLRGLKDACSISVNCQTIESIVLRMLYEIDETALAPREALVSRVPAAEARVAAVKRRMDDLRAALVNTAVDAPSPLEITEALASLGEQLVGAERTLAEAIASSATATGTDLAQARDLLLALRAAPEAGQRAMRLRLRSVLSRLVEVIKVDLVKRKNRVVPNVTIVMRSGEKKYLLDGRFVAAVEQQSDQGSEYKVLAVDKKSLSVASVRIRGNSRTVKVTPAEDGIDPATAG